MVRCTRSFPIKNIWTQKFVLFSVVDLSEFAHFPQGIASTGLTHKEFFTSAERNNMAAKLLAVVLIRKMSDQLAALESPICYLRNG